MWGKGPVQVPYLCNTSMYSPTRKLSEPCLFSEGVIDYVLAIGDCQPSSLSSPQSWGWGLSVAESSNLVVLRFRPLATSPHL